MLTRRIKRNDEEFVVEGLEGRKEDHCHRREGHHGYDCLQLR